MTDPITDAVARAIRLSYGTSSHHSWKDDATAAITAFLEAAREDEDTLFRVVDALRQCTAITDLRKDGYIHAARAVLAALAKQEQHDD